jgi:hypothetical protein
MAPPNPKKRKAVADGTRGKVAAPTKKFKKKQQYTSDSDSDGGAKLSPAAGENLRAINLQGSEDAQIGVE